MNIINKYIALLRGINISGKNKISMAELKTLFEELGFGNVKTYINSGNVIFKSNIDNIAKLINKIELGILDRFNLNIPVTVISEDELSLALNNTPDWWAGENDYLYHIVFLIPPITVEEVYNATSDLKVEYEKRNYHENIIFWSAKSDVFTKTRFSKIASSSVNNNVTIRTMNTVNKLYKLISDIE